MLIFREKDTEHKREIVLDDEQIKILAYIVDMHDIPELSKHPISQKEKESYILKFLGLKSIMKKCLYELEGVNKNALLPEQSETART